MAVPYTFGSATSAIPLSQLDSNFATAITLGSTALTLGTTTTTVVGLTLTSPTFTTPVLGTPSSGTLTNCTGLPISTGVSGLGTGVATALAVNTGSSGALVINGGALGTPSSGTLTNCTGYPTSGLSGNINLATQVTGTLGTTNGGTGLTSFTANGVVYASSSSALTTGSGLVFDGTNFGLGVTPNAWLSSRKAFDLGGAVSTVTGANITIFGNNYYVDTSSTARYVTTGAAAQAMVYPQAGGVQWNTANSGTAGNAITFTQAMTLDASGNLIIGDTSTSSGLTLVRSGSTTAEFKLNQTGTGGHDYRVGSTGTGYGTAGKLIFYDATAGAERMCIDSSGNLLVGQTTAGLLNGNGVSLNPAANYSTFNHVSGTGSGTGYVVFGYAGGLIGSITQSGTTAVLYNTTSDRRLKENIEDAESASALIDSLQVRQFNWKSDNSHQRYGFIAQELVTVAPEAVHQPADTEEMMVVDYSKLVPMLVKEIQSLRKRLAAAGIA